VPEKEHTIKNNYTHTFSNTNLSQQYKQTIMLKKINLHKLIQTQIKSFSFVVFVITFGMIFLNSSSNIIPLNILTFLGSILLFHYYPNYYDIVNSRKPKLTPLLASFDFILHYLPLIYIYMFKVFLKTEINYSLSLIIILSYLLLFHSEIRGIYFNINQYFF